MRRCDLDVQLFDDLLSAFRQDVTVRRYETWDDLLDYCRRSANPVGRLVLRIAGYRDARLDACSDAVCTALQLTNFWQDLEGDLKKDAAVRSARPKCGRRSGHRGSAQVPPDPGMAARVEAAGARTRALFAAGRPLPTPCAAACAGNCARPGSAACASSTGSRRPGSTCSHRARRSARSTRS